MDVPLPIQAGVIQAGTLQVRLLLVDDSRDVSTILRALLSGRRRLRQSAGVRDYVIEQVETVQAGMAAMQAGSHDCYLVDYHVGAESGLDLVRMARGAGLLVPIVMLTGSDTIDSEAAKAGANDFLVKGDFDIMMFERTIRYAIGNADSLQRMAELNASLERQVDERTRQYMDANNRLLEQIAAREQAETALVRTERLQALGRMTGSVAHDFNNILTALFSSLEVLQTRLEKQWGDTPDPRIARPLANAVEASRLGERMVDGLLAFARDKPLAPTLIDVNTVIGETERLLRLTLGSGVRLRLSLAEGLPPVLADRDQLERALLNLASNARDALQGLAGHDQPDGCFRIDTAKPPSADGEPGVRITLSDNGPGMSHKTLIHAFEPFFSTKQEGKGTGLGLAQVYGFAQQSGGHVAIDSKPGAGVRVTLTLPAAT